MSAKKRNSPHGTLTEKTKAQTASRQSNLTPPLAEHVSDQTERGSVLTQNVSLHRDAAELSREPASRVSDEQTEIARLQQVSTRRALTCDSVPLLRDILDAAVVVTRSDMGNIQLLDRSRDLLEIVVSCGFEKPFLDYFRVVHRDDAAACSAALSEGRRIVVEDILRSSVFGESSSLDVMMAAGVRAVVSSPLVSRSGAIVGILSTHYRKPCRPAPRDLAVLDLLARQAADWIEHTHEAEALRQSEETLRAILRTAVDAIITIDKNGIIQSTNPAAEKLFGFSASEMVGRNVSMLMPSPYRDQHDAFLARYLETGQKSIIGVGREVVAQRKDGTQFPIELAVSEVDHLQVFAGVIHDISQRKRLEREVVRIASLEQQRIGEDLHDTICQELTALNLQVDDLREALETDPQAVAKLAERIADGLQRSQRELRSLMRGMLPVSVDAEGLMSALTDLADRTERDTHVICTFECPKPVALTDSLSATHLYLIGQEAVHNAVKHGESQQIRISLMQVNGAICLKVVDDGVGMSKIPAEHPGLGLRIMHNRAAILGATLTIEAADSGGTVVSCVYLSKVENECQRNKTPNGHAS